MLTSLELENYRCFEKHTVDFKDTSIIVGQNNAGKSTIVEALRLISIVASRALNFQETPGWLDLPASYKGVSPSLAGLDFPKKSLFHKYQDGPALVTAHFESKAKIVIYLGSISDDDIGVFALIFDNENKIRKTRQSFKDAGIPEINILPQISALAKEETVLNYDYVRSNLTTQLSSIHFRNQIKYYYDYFPKFRELSESTWQGLGIKDLDGRSLFKGGQLTLIVRDSDFAAEIGWMGHGLQMWLQTMWFLAKSKEDSTIILDEPDVYMHADLQRKLIRFLKSRYKQVIIATHSIEIISEVEPENILVIDKKKPTSNYSNSVPAVQSLLNSIGSIHNIGLARLWSSKKLLLVEGKDISILKRLQDTLFTNNSDPFDIIPSSSIGGWNGWQFVKGADFVLKNGLKQDINVYCILDSDYHSQTEIEERMKEAKSIGVCLHIWEKKEIENYLLSPSAIFRILERNTRTSNLLTLQKIEKKLDKLTEGMKTEITDKFADEIQSKNKKWQPSTVNKEARKFVESHWHNKMDMISGKELITKFNNWSNSHYKASLSVNGLARELRRDEIPSEVKSIITAIEKNQRF
jgi:predicted ATP-dependent endonuclease of OLD family